MSGRELSRMLRHARKQYVVRVANGHSEQPDLRVECHTRERAEVVKRRYKREGHSARVEAIVG